MLLSNAAALIFIIFFSRSLLETATTFRTASETHNIIVILQQLTVK